jgi:predicted CXXCH cytochrome family protein
MTRRLLVAVLAAAAALAPRAARAVNEPHVKALDPAVSCTSCHTMHAAPGVSLTSVPGNFNLCASCHNQPGVGVMLGFPWYSEDQAVPGASGRSHRWDAPLTGHGALPPLDPGLAAKTADGALQCSTCHDAHNANPEMGGRQHVSVPVETDLAPNAGTGTGTGTLRVATPAAGATAKGYLAEIVAGGAAGTATWRLSNDSGRTWFGWSGTAWVAWSTTTPNARVTGADQLLNDLTNVKVTFAGSGFTPGDRWTFYVAYPMLRMSIATSGLCEDCHRNMVHTSVRVAGDDPAFPPNVGENTFSHPVGETLGGNGRGYDRATPLRPDGSPQVPGASAQGDLVLAPTDATVRCLTCHAVHNAASSSLPQ